jgi:uncharacterized protein YprB with RNaseH-like and TPR domain
VASARVLLFDFETTALVADFGTIIAVGWKWLDEPDVHVWTGSPRSDKALVRRFAAVWNQADVLVAYNGVRFDRPMFYAKLLEHGLELPANTPFVDPYFTARSNLRLSRKSLDNVARFLELDVQKTPVTGRVWKAATHGSPAERRQALTYIAEHCRLDVLVLEQVYLRLRPLMRTHPRVGALEACRHCGGLRLQRRGYRPPVGSGRYRRLVLQCTGCRAYEVRALTAAERKVVGQVA